MTPREALARPTSWAATPNGSPAIRRSAATGRRPTAKPRVSAEAHRVAAPAVPPTSWAVIRSSSPATLRSAAMARRPTAKLRASAEARTPAPLRVRHQAPLRVRHQALRRGVAAPPTSKAVIPSSSPATLRSAATAPKPTAKPRASVDERRRKRRRRVPLKEVGIDFQRRVTSSSAQSTSVAERA